MHDPLIQLPSPGGATSSRFTRRRSAVAVAFGAALVVSGCGAIADKATERAVEEAIERSVENDSGEDVDMRAALLEGGGEVAHDPHDAVRSRIQPPDRERDVSRRRSGNLRLRRDGRRTIGQ